jgi:hypothetical protein
MVTPVATPALIWISVAANLPLALVIVQLFIMAAITVLSEQHLARLNQVPHSRESFAKNTSEGPLSCGAEQLHCEAGRGGESPRRLRSPVLHTKFVNYRDSMFPP